MMPNELEGVIEDMNRSLLKAAATCLFYNVRLEGLVADLRALIAIVLFEASETLALEVR